jgi:Ras GTPase-activating-like protein IQGAP2/3
LAIVTPDAYNVVDKELEPVVRKNLVVVGKVLQNLFNFRLFSKQEKYMMPLNDFIEKNKVTVEHYFNSLVKVSITQHLPTTQALSVEDTLAHISLSRLLPGRRP